VKEGEGLGLEQVARCFIREDGGVVGREERRRRRRVLPVKEGEDGDVEGKEVPPFTVFSMQRGLVIGLPRVGLPPR
jgi:hypothetical protein